MTDDEKLDDLLSKIKKYRFKLLIQYNKHEDIKLADTTYLKSITRTKRSDGDNHIVIRDVDGYEFELYVWEQDTYEFGDGRMIIYKDEIDTMELMTKGAWNKL